jgi:hypothetical protein
MKRFIVVALILLSFNAQAQNYLRDDGQFHSVVEGTAPGQVLYNLGGQLTGLAPGASNNCIVSNGTVWASAACPTGGGGGTVAAGFTNQLGLYAADGTTISGLATANNGVLVTNGSGVPSISTTLPSGLSASFTNLTATSSFTATGLVTNSDLANATITSAKLVNSGVTPAAYGPCVSLTLNMEGIVTGASSVACTFRIQLTTPTTFFVNPSGSSANCNGVTCGAGSDSTGNGTQTTPWATRSHTIAVLAGNYDLNGQSVLIQESDATYTDSFQYYGSKLFGQGSPSSLVFQGNCTTPANVLIQPSAGAGYTYGFFYGFAAQIQCQKVDQTNQFASLGADTLSLGQGSFMYLGNKLIFGCNYPGMGSNAVTITTGAQLYLNSQTNYTIDPTLCQATTTGTWSSGATTVTIASATGVHVGMGIADGTASHIPADAYIGILSGTTVTLSCIVTSPCQTSGTGSGSTVYVYGGGQFFMNAGSGGLVFATTNNQSELSDIVTVGGLSFYYDMIFANGLSNFNFQGITWINPGSQRGGCFEAVNISVVDTGLAGIPYLPCLAGPSVLNLTTATLTSGSPTFTVAGGGAALIKVGMAISGYAGPTGTWTAGSSSIALNSALGSCNGGVVSGPGILAGGGAIITNLVSTTATLQACVSSGRCVSSYATYLPETGAQLAVTGCGVPAGSWVTAVSGSSITVNKPATASGSQTVLFAAAGGGVNYTGVQDSSVYH